MPDADTNPESPPPAPVGLAGTVIRTAVAVVATGAAFAATFAVLLSQPPGYGGWRWSALPGVVELATVAVLAGTGLLYVMLRVGGMGRCLTCQRVIPVFWGAAYCPRDEAWVARMGEVVRVQYAWLSLYRKHGVQRVADMVTEMGERRVLALGLGDDLPDVVPVSEAEARRRLFGSGGYHYSDGLRPATGTTYQGSQR